MKRILLLFLFVALTASVALARERCAVQGSGVDLEAWEEPAASAAMSQDRYSLHGSVVDSKSGEPLAGVAVTVRDNSSLWAETDAYGKFALKMPKGSYVLVVSLVGYQTLEYGIQLDEDSRINISYRYRSSKLGLHHSLS